jgi:FixJ family two-component response regulator
MPGETAPFTVHVVDDDAAVLRSTAFLLRAAGYHAETYPSPTVLLDKLDTLSPGCVVTDVRMPGINGLELQERLAAERSDLPVIVITGHGDVSMAVRAMRAGATDFIEKPFTNEMLLGAVESARNCIQRRRTEQAALEEIAARMRRLTPREREVMLLVAEGWTSKEIAKVLGLSHRTVELHRAMILGKMQASSLAALIRMVLATEHDEGTRPGAI